MLGRVPKGSCRVSPLQPMRNPQILKQPEAVHIIISRYGACGGATHLEAGQPELDAESPGGINCTK